MSDKIKRYDHEWEANGWSGMTEYPDGDYVRAEDHEAALAAKEARIAELEQKVIGLEDYAASIPDYRHLCKELRDKLTAQQQAEPLIDTSAWQSCNPGCDPEFNGEKGRHCVCDPAKAAMSAKKANPINPEMVDVVGYTTAGMLRISKDLPLTGRIGAKCKPDERWNVPLMTVAQHERIVAAKDAEIARLQQFNISLNQENTRLFSDYSAADDECVKLRALLDAQPARQVGGDEPAMFVGENLIKMIRNYECVGAVRVYRENADGRVPLYTRAALSTAAVESRDDKTLIAETIGFEFAPGELQTVNANDLLRLVVAARAKSSSTVLMPQRARVVGFGGDKVAEAYNCALDEVARLNRRAIPAGLLEKAADLLKSYQQVIDGCHSSEIERFDYQPEVQGTADELRALLDKGD